MTVRRVGAIGVADVVRETITSGVTWTPPPGVNRILAVTCVGAGGGGGSGKRNTDGSGGGGGGGSGATSTFFGLDVSGGAVDISIGAGGAGGAARTTASNGATAASGGNTWFKESKFSANGGNGGSGGGSGASAGGGGGGSRNFANGATAGQGSIWTAGPPATAGTVQTQFLSDATVTGSGGGATGAETLNRFGRRGGAGTPTAGGAAGSAYDQTTAVDMDGVTATDYGCGGGGGAGACSASVSSGAGGTGGNGVIYVWYVLNTRSVR